MESFKGIYPNPNRITNTHLQGLKFYKIYKFRRLLQPNDDTIKHFQHPEETLKRVKENGLTADPISTKYEFSYTKKKK